ncbi:pupal cuticle protein C1B-like [Condylostylus longicornis]|uniref:pupal cuticle protein C1B-like n=1 Tax=Condylostylus longicornis TaxID=2530218 RepID=UPI00244DDF65|nr:pupal cuticle protein C1B-like [Condylostylus longicornis]
MLKFILALILLYTTTILGYDGPAIVSQDQNILRSYGNLGQVSTYSKTLDTPFTSVRKADVRISNPGIIASPAYAHVGYPATASIGYPGLVTTAHHAVLPTISHASYVKPAPIATIQHHIPTASYVTPAITGKTIIPAGASGSLLGVAYSAAPTVSHMSFSNGLGLSYEW